MLITGSEPCKQVLSETNQFFFFLVAHSTHINRDRKLRTSASFVAGLGPLLANTGTLITRKLVDPQRENSLA